MLVLVCLMASTFFDGMVKFVSSGTFYFVRCTSRSPLIYRVSSSQMVSSSFFHLAQGFPSRALCRVGFGEERRV